MCRQWFRCVAALLVIHHERDELGAARGIEFFKDPVEVGFDRMLTEDEPVCNLLIRIALTDMFDDLFFPGGYAVYLAGL
jgi:hypothetical protein